MNKNKKILLSIILIETLLLSACSQTGENPQQNLSSGKCGDGFCEDMERAENSCPIDCIQEIPDDAGPKNMPSGLTVNETANNPASPSAVQPDGDFSTDADGFLWGTEATGRSDATTSAIKNTLKTRYVKYRLFADSCSSDFKTFSAQCAVPRLSDPKQNFNLDKVVDYYSQNGWSMIPMLSYSSDDPNTMIRTSQDVDDYVNFVYWFVKNYHDKANIKYIELINAPNMDNALLLEAQNQAYDLIKNEFPNILVGTHGFEYWDDPAHELNMIAQIEYFLDIKNGAKFDFWAFHGYPMRELLFTQDKQAITYPPTKKPVSNKYANIYGILEIRKRLDENGWQDRFIIDAEHFGVLKPRSEITEETDKLDAAYMVQELLLKKTLRYNGGMAMAGAIPFKIAARGAIGEFGNAALNPDGSITRSVQAVGLLWSKFDKYNYDSRISGDFDKDDVWIERFKSGNNEMYVFFKPFNYEWGKTIYLDGEIKEYGLALDEMPSKITLTDINGDEEEIAPAQSITLRAENSPKYLQVEYR